MILNKDLSVTCIRGRIVLPPGPMQGSHREGCLPSEQSLSLAFYINILKPYLEDGDCVVADHVGPRKGLGKEKEHKKCHWKKDSPGRQCYGSEERSNIGKGKYPCKAENLGISIVRCDTCQRS